jgi:hypothetical protein
MKPKMTVKTVNQLLNIHQQVNVSQSNGNIVITQEIDSGTNSPTTVSKLLAESVTSCIGRKAYSTCSYQRLKGKSRLVAQAIIPCE